MAKFIELLDRNNRNALINIDNITSIVIYKEADNKDEEPEEHVRIFTIGDKDSYLTVKESFDEIRAKLEGVSEVTDLR